MATKPTKVTDWATDVGALTSPTTTDRQEFGWKTVPDNLPSQPGERPNLNQQNYWQLAVHEWQQYFEVEVDDLISGKEPTITGAATTITASDLALSRAVVSDGSGKVAVSTTTAAELLHVNGVTSAIQTQFTGKEATITGGATTITGSDLTVSRALVSDGSGKVATSTTTSAELLHVNGVTSAIQTQFTGKEPTITGGATTITGSDLTVSRAVVSDGSGKVAVSTTTAAELLHVNGVTSAIQTQFTGKEPTLPLTTRGDLLVRNASNITARLPVGADTHVLTSDGVDIAWAAGGGGGGGGQNLYDAIVDAGGGGDYTTISSAYTTEAAGSTIYVRNGTYSESAFITIKAGTKLIGESRDGVVITFTGTSWGLFRGEFGAYRGGSERTANNDAWNTTNMGTVSVTTGSADVVYTGTTNPVAADLIHIAPNFYAIASSVDTGTKTITLDRNWGGDTLSGLDIMVHDTIVTDTETRTEFSNFTIIINSTGSVSAFRNLDSAYNMHISDIKISATAVASAASVFNLQATMRSSVNDVEIDCNSQTTLKPFLIYNGIADFHCNSIIAYNVSTNGVQFQGSTRAIRRSTLHFKSLACSGHALTSMTGVYQTDIRFDVVQCDRLSAASGGSAANLAESRVEVRKANVNSSFSVFEGIKSFFAFNYISDGVQVFNQTNATDFVCITDSYVDGTLTVDTETVISGSVMYDAISGTPAQNNGFEF